MRIIYYSKIEWFDIANGEGVRVSLFVSGCSNHCNGCFNPEAWEPTYGQEFTSKEIEAILNKIEEYNMDGLSILGGDPLESYNLNSVSNLIDKFRKRFGYKKTIWMWTGYQIECIINSPQFEVARKVDVLIDGKFIMEKKDLTLAYRGSTNQRIIDMKKSQIFNTLILKEEYK